MAEPTRPEIFAQQFSAIQEQYASDNELALRLGLTQQLLRAGTIVTTGDNESVDYLPPVLPAVVLDGVTFNTGMQKLRITEDPETCWLIVGCELYLALEDESYVIEMTYQARYGVRFEGQLRQENADC